LCFFYCKKVASEIALRYNKEKIGEGLETISNLYLTDTEFKETMSNPRIKNDIKIDIIKEASLNDEVFINFIDLLLKENRFNLISDIYKKYIDMVNKLNKVIEIVIISACDISEKEANSIASKYQKLYDASKVKYEIKLDKSLIGGVRVICDGKIYDDSIRTKLDEML